MSYESELLNDSSLVSGFTTVSPTDHGSSFSASSSLPSSSSSSLISLRQEPWIPPLIGLSTLNIFLILSFEAFVIYKAFHTIPSRRHLFLGQMLLFGLFMSSLIALGFVPNINWFSCAVTRVGLSLGYCIIFGTLLVKTVFLLSLHSGTYLPLTYQAFLLFFILLTQVVVDVQWLINMESAVITVKASLMTLTNTTSTVLTKDMQSATAAASAASARLTCNHSLSSQLYSLVYNAFLILLTVCLSIKIRGHRENYREALFILITSVSTIVIWLIWILGAVINVDNESLKDAFLAYGLLLSSLMVFILMFAPKARQLATLGGHTCSSFSTYNNEEVDREDTDSPNSLYGTPSFVQFKPSLLPLMSNGGCNNLGDSMHKSRGSNWNFYKQFNGLHQVSPHQPLKPIAGDRILYMSPTPGPPPPPGSRVWRSTFPSYGNNSSHHNQIQSNLVASNNLGGSKSSNRSSKNHLYQVDSGSRGYVGPTVEQMKLQNPNLKFFRACY